MSKQLLVAVPVAFLFVGQGVANAGKTEEEVGTLVCLIDKWNETEPAKEHKLVDYAGRCMIVPDDPAGPKVTEECTGKFEYKPDKSWKANGMCTDTYPNGDKKYITWEEGSHLNKEYAAPANTRASRAAALTGMRT
jgi:hypothetical protein